MVSRAMVWAAAVSAAAVLWAAAGALARADEWLQWRGPHRDGVALDARLPVDWPAEPPPPIWRATVGEGFSSPVVAAGRVYIMGREAQGNAAQETCLAFDAATGKLVWRHAYPVAFIPPDPTGGLGPKSTPTVDRDRVFMLGLGGMLHCLAAGTGRVLWKHDLAAEFWGVVKDEAGDDAWSPCCGSAASPLIDGSTVVMSVGGPKAGAFAAFDRRGGDLVWSALDDRGSYGSPVIVELAGVRQLVGFTGVRMVGLDAATRDLLWDCPFEAEFDQTVLTPVVWNDLVILGGEKKPTLAVRISRGPDGLVSQSAWENAQLRAYLTTPVVFGDHLVGLDSRTGRLVCLACATGNTEWTSPSIGNHASLVRAGEQILALAVDGELWVAAADPAQWKLRANWVLSPQGGTWAHPAISGSRIYVKDKSQLLCFDLAAGGKRPGGRAGGGLSQAGP